MQLYCFYVIQDLDALAAELNNLGGSVQPPLPAIPASASSVAPGPSNPARVTTNSTPLVEDDSDDEGSPVDHDGTLQVSGPSRPL